MFAPVVPSFAPISLKFQDVTKYENVHFDNHAVVCLCSPSSCHFGYVFVLNPAFGNFPLISSQVDLGHAKYQGVALENGVNQWLNVRYAAPCNGTNRFKPAQPVLNQTDIQDASQNGPLCVAAGEQEGFQYDSERQYMAEDCLNMGIFAPANATRSSKLPIMYFIQGGGFSSNSNGNFNGSALVEASGGNMIVVRINYRVGILGFIGGTDVANHMGGAASTNGLRDMVTGAKFIQQHAEAFGGDPNHIVLSGDSSGAEAIVYLLASNNGTGWPGLFVGAAVESTGIYGTGRPVDRDEAYYKNLNATGCLNATNPIECMRAIPIAEFQSLITSDGWGPTIDNEYCTAPHYQMYEQGRFQKIPVIFGSTSNEGAAIYIANTAADSEDDIRSGLASTIPSATNETLDLMMKLYPESLANTSFFSRDVSRPSNDSYWSGTGSQWQRDVSLRTELKQTCTGAFFSDMNAAEGNTANWHYRYNILDSTPGGFAAQGLFTPHASDLYAIWGPNNTDGGDPACLKLDASDSLSCATGGKIMQAYWISFVRSLDPNTYRLAGTPEWGAWTIEEPNRIVFDNTEATLEVMGAGIDEVEVEGLNQRTRCVAHMLSLSKAVAEGLSEGETLPPFANGTREDPTLKVLNATTTTTYARSWLTSRVSRHGQLISA